VQYNGSPLQDAIKDENCEAARRMVRHCDALYETFLRCVRCVLHEDANLFTEDANAKLLLADDGAEKICSDLCMSVAGAQGLRKNEESEGEC
jgi:hypothetical protein